MVIIVIRVIRVMRVTRVIRGGGGVVVVSLTVSPKVFFCVLDLYLFSNYEHSRPLKWLYVFDKLQLLVSCDI